MRVRLTKVAAVWLALCFPWLSVASGGMTLCFGPDGRVGFGPGGELACAGAEGLVGAGHSPAAPCSDCLDANGCAHVPGKGLLERPPPGPSQRRAVTQAVPYALSIAHTDYGMQSLPVLPPAHILDGQHSMRLRLATLRTVVLRL